MSRSPVREELCPGQLWHVDKGQDGLDVIWMVLWRYDGPMPEWWCEEDGGVSVCRWQQGAECGYCPMSFRALQENATCVAFMHDGA